MGNLAFWMLLPWDGRNLKVFWVLILQRIPKKAENTWLSSDRTFEKKENVSNQHTCPHALLAIIAIAVQGTTDALKFKVKMSCFSTFFNTLKYWQDDRLWFAPCCKNFIPHLELVNPVKFSCPLRNLDFFSKVRSKSLLNEL